MDGYNPTVMIAILVVLAVFEFILYSYSAAIQALSEQQLDIIANQHPKCYRKIYRIIDNPARFIDTVQAVSMLFILTLGVYGLELVSKQFEKYDSRLPGIFILGICAIVFVFIILIVLVKFPKRLGTNFPIQITRILTGCSSMIVTVFLPFTVLLHVIAKGIFVLCRLKEDDVKENVTEEDIISVIQEGHEQGVLLASEAEMIHNIVEFGDKEAKDIMTHRKSILAVDGNQKLSQVVDYILNEKNSRFPVYLGDIDNIIGITTLRDVMEAYQSEQNQDVLLKDIDGLIRKATFIPETRRINVLFKHMQSEKIHMAIVIDEYGQTAGIVAMEDILEEIVGNILDEYDDEELNIVSRQDGSYIVKGITTLEEITDVVGIAYPDEYDTLNGFLTSKLQRILSGDERPEVVADGVTYRILGVQNKMISLVQIIK